MNERESLIAARLREEADTSEKGLAFMGDPELIEETQAQIAMLREAADEIERLQGKVAGLENVLRVARAGRSARPDEVLTRDELLARHGQDAVIELVEEALRVF